MQITVGQVAEALGLSVCELLAERLANLPGSNFEQAMATAEDVSDVAEMCLKAAGLLESATWAEVDAAWREAFAAMSGEATSHGYTLLETSVASTVEAAKSTVTSTYESLHSAKDVYLVTSDGSYQNVTTAWRTMQAEAASTVASKTTSDWMESYTDLLASKGVGISVGDSGVREIAGAVRTAAREAQIQACDKITRQTAQSCGMDAAQISVHNNCAPDHVDYQGHIYTLEEITHINETIGRPIGTGAMNCRHSLLYCYSDSKSMYTQEELDAIKAQSESSVTYTGRNGQTITSSSYQATQYMRSSELQIRKLKQTIAIKSAAGLDTSTLATKVEKATASYKNLCSELGQNYSTSRITAYTMDDL